MKIKRTAQIELKEIENLKFDVVLVASGYESRSRHLAESIEITCENKFCITFNNFKDLPVRIYNDSVLKNLGYKLTEANGDSEKEVTFILKNFFEKNVGGHFNILIDYTSMTRIWYAAILTFFRLYETQTSTVTLYLNYSVSQYVDPAPNETRNRCVGPIEGFYSISIPNKPSALIIGLGYIESRAFGLSEYFDVEPFLFITDSTVSGEFSQNVKINNLDLIRNVRESNIFYYPLNNLTYTETLLFHLCQDLLQNFRVVLAPCGPKPFTLMCLVASLRLEYVDVWRISAGEGENPTDKMPTGEKIIYTISYL